MPIFTSACFRRIMRGRSGVVAGGVLFGVAKSGEGFEDRSNVGEARAGEIAGDGFGRDRGGGLHQVVAHGTDALGKGKRPGKTHCAGGLLLFLLHLHAEACLGRGGALKFGAEPADEAGAFFGGTGGVEFDQAEKNIFGGKLRGPAVGFGDGVIEIVVEFAENRDEAAVVNGLAGGRERLAGGRGAGLPGSRRVRRGRVRSWRVPRRPNRATDR